MESGSSLPKDLKHLSNPNLETNPHLFKSNGNYVVYCSPEPNTGLRVRAQSLICQYLAFCHIVCHDEIGCCMACIYQFRSISLQSNLTARATVFLRYTTSNTFGTMLNSGSWMEPLGCDDMPQTCFDFPGIPTFDRPGGLRGCTSRLMLICDADPGGGLFANVMMQNGTMEFQNCSSQVDGTETKFLKDVGPALPAILEICQATRG